MHAVTLIDGDLEWREHPDPEPGARELLVRVRAAGLNNADMVQRRGHYPGPADAPPDIPGLELAGEVVAIGPRVESFAVGDRVMAIVSGGAQAELALVHERTALRVPDDLTWAEAGGFPEVFSTAHDALFTQCGLTAGEHLLVHGAAGGMGVAGVQLGLLAGAQVSATVRNAALRGAVEDLGPRVTVVPPDEFPAYGPFDVVLELIGQVNLPADVESLADGGRITVIGVSGNGRAEIDVLSLMRKRGRIHGSTLRMRPLEQKAEVAQRVANQLLGPLADGRIRVPVEATYALADARAAYDRFTSGGKFGKIVLVDDTP